MTTGQVYRLSSATLGILSIDNFQRIPVTVPTNALVTVLDGDINGNRFVDCEWEGKTLTMFAIDVRVRGEIVSG